MAIKVYEIKFLDADGTEQIKTVQVKRKDMAWKWIAEKIREGLLPATAEYKVELTNIK